MSTTAPDTGSPAPPPAGSTRHLVWLFAPAGTREALAALFAVESEIAASLRPGLDHGIAHARLEWWDGECGRLASGRPTHPFTRLLLDGALALQASPPDLSGLVYAARVDLAAVACETRAELDDVLQSWARAAFRTVVALGAGGLRTLGAAERFAQQAGLALREIETLSTLATDAWSGRIRVPLATDPDAPARWRTQPWPEDCARLVAARLAEARGTLAAAASALEPSQRPAQRAALVWCALAARLGARAAACLPMQHGHSRIDALADTICAWRAALATERGRLPTALRIVQ
jgi:phytoene synthase